MVVSFAPTVGEFGVVLIVGGNIAGVTRTVSMSLDDGVSALNDAAAKQTARFLLAFSFVVLALTYLLQREGEGR
jgi:molybdate transport system permease protein